MTAAQHTTTDAREHVEKELRRLTSDRNAASIWLSESFAAAMGTLYFQNAAKLQTLTMQCNWLLGLLQDLTRTDADTRAREARIYALLTTAETERRAMKFPVTGDPAALLAHQCQSKELAYRAEILAMFATPGHQTIFQRFLTGF
jgi:hypothetical protein